ncbi:MAG TPA: asparaginase domain-containing protein [Candidatus Nanoarchaeia archaeon]|nr:asparaginase domain-containing protein [Candidatus Nanoarchaeia archaeon]
MTKNKLHFIITGGTIDSYFDPITEKTLPCEHSYIPKFVDILKLYESITFSEVFMKDSRDINDKDREKILQEIEKSNSTRIIITHGSYTVAETAKYINTKTEKIDKVIIFVCSMIPINGFAPTDAGFNLGYAVAKSQDLKNGIYVCMNGKVFAPEEVVKILSEGRFGSIYKK